jgi:hypothetical protein
MYISSRTKCTCFPQKLDGIPNHSWDTALLAVPAHEVL